MVDYSDETDFLLKGWSNATIYRIEGDSSVVKIRNSECKIFGELLDCEKINVQSIKDILLILFKEQHATVIANVKGNPERYALYYIPESKVEGVMNTLHAFGIKMDVELNYGRNA